LLLIGFAVVLAQPSWSQNVVNQFPAPVVSPPWVEGLSYGGGSLWFSNAWEVRRLDPYSGNTYYKFSVAGYINGLAYVSGDLWLARVTPPALVRVDSFNGQHKQVIDTSDQGYPEGLAWDGHRLIFSVDGPPAALYTVNVSTGEISLLRASSVTDPESLAYGGGFLWEGGKTDATLHKLDGETAQEITTFQAPAPNVQGLAWDGTYLWADSDTTRTIYQIDVSRINVAPVLTHPQLAGYGTDGVDPNSGTSATTFNFRTVYTDADNDAPVAVYLHLLRSGMEISGSPFFMYNETGATTYDQGVLFLFSTTLGESLDYSYYFSAVNAHHSAMGPATGQLGGPQVSNAPPTLSWTGEPGYTTGGVAPSIGQPLTTNFVYRVRYFGVLPATYVNLNILKGGAPIPHSPFRMATSDPTPYLGQIYTYTKTLPKSRDYTYYFDASDGTQNAVGDPTSPANGPIVGNQPPVLSWTGEPGFVKAGVSPHVGPPDQPFAYHVKYTDPDGDIASFVKLHVTRHDQEVTGSPFSLSVLQGGKPKLGVIYGMDLSLPLGADYAYWFEASDGFQTASGPPTAESHGPIVDAPPQLEWVSHAPYMNSGVNPKRGGAPLRCTFQVRYRDLDDNPAKFVRVHITRGGHPIEDSPFPMTLVKPGRPQTGQIFGCQVVLDEVGPYSYRFAANDGYLDALGVPIEWQTGPTVTGATAAQLTSLTATPTENGIAVTFNLSAAGTVDAQVVNLAGRPIQSLAANRACAAGLNALLWDGHTASGLSAPNGTYLVAVTVRGASGAQSRAVRQVTLQR
jgi:hypothetical protein